MSEAADIRTTCPYCGVGCGLTVAAGRHDRRRHGASGQSRAAVLERRGARPRRSTIHGRLLYPEIGGVRAGWDEALDLVAGMFRRHDRRARAGLRSRFYVSGQFLTEDYYVANKLMKGFIGTANIDTNSRLCMASSVAGHIRAFGEDVVPGVYEDIDEADLVVLVGSNAAWCHPVLYQRLADAKQARGTRIVVIDPRRTATCDIADLHLAIRPGSDVALFNGAAAPSGRERRLRPRLYRRAHDRVRRRARGRARVGAVARRGGARSPMSIPAISRRFYDWFAAHRAHASRSIRRA